MVGSIDPRCDTARGTHWPKKVAWLFGARVAETILASGPKSPHQQAGHMDASDPIKPSKKLLWHGGRPHMWHGSRSRSLSSGGASRRPVGSLVRDDVNSSATPDSMFKQPKKIHVRDPAARCVRVFTKTVRPKRIEGAGNAGCPLHPKPRVRNLSEAHERSHHRFTGVD